MSYGAETWTLTKKEEQAMLIFERKIFRRIYGPKYENGEWKSRTSRELEEMSKGENIVKWIKGQMISWLGHVERMEEDRMPKQDLHSRTGRDEKTLCLVRAEAYQMSLLQTSICQNTGVFGDCNTFSKLP